MLFLFFLFFSFLFFTLFYYYYYFFIPETCFFLPLILSLFSSQFFLYLFLWHVFRHNGYFSPFFFFYPANVIQTYLVFYVYFRLSLFVTKITIYNHINYIVSLRYALKHAIFIQVPVCQILANAQGSNEFLTPLIMALILLSLESMATKWLHTDQDFSLY